ncbi:MAG TPA: response regulator [Actinomycetota bacterium]|nr:response regulator [Actinomycetota bacterium]
MKKCVLVVEDEPDLRRLFGIMLSGAGYDVVDAPSGERAIEIVKESLPDAMLLDLRMPGVDGWEVLARLKKEELLESIPVIVISAHTGGDTAAAAERSGASDYLAKPVDREQLLSAIARVV